MLMEAYFGDDDSKWPSLLKQLKDEELDLPINALGMAFSYLIDALMDEQIIIPGSFYKYEPASMNNRVAQGGL